MVGSFHSGSTASGNGWFKRQGLLRVQHGEISDLALKLGVERTRVPAAALPAQLMRRGAESPPFLARKAERSIDHDPCHGLTIALTHQSGLVRVDNEALLRDDPVHDRPEF